MKKILVLGAICLSLGACNNPRKTPSAENTDRNMRADTTERNVRADNTERNMRDRNPDAMTAGSQSETAQDRDITQRIRRALMDDNSLSTTAKNIKVITINANVTLKGPVRTQNEKETIVARAREVEGVANVNDQLEIIR